MRPIKASKPEPKTKAAPKPKKAAEPVKRGTKRAPPETKAKAQKKRKVASQSEDKDEESALGSPVPDLCEDDLSEEEVTTKKAPPKSRTKKTTKGSEAKATQKPKPKKFVDSDEEDEASLEPQSTKRASKKVIDSDDEDEASPQPEKRQEAYSDVEMEESPAPAEAPVTQEDASESEMSVVIDEEPPSKKKQTREPAPKAIEAYASDSEMSVLIDQEPPPKKRRQKKDPSSKPIKSTKPKADSKAKAPAKAKPELSPQEAQIKELQGNLVKCGIRKMWHNELKNFDTAKEKIGHLKGMLKDAGMDGRFSESKAKEIKEKRELEKDIESAKDFASKFGAQEDKGRRKMGNKDWGIDESLLGGGKESDSD